MSRNRVDVLILSHAGSGFSMVKTSQLVARCVTDFPEAVICVRPPSYLSKKISSQKLRKYVRYVELYILFPFRLIVVRLKYSINRVMIVDHSDAIHLYYFPKNRAIALVHDQFAYLAAQSMIPGIKIKILGKIYQRVINKGLRRSRKLLAVSNYTRNQLINLGFPQKIDVLNLTWDPWPLDENQYDDAGLSSKKYGILVSPNTWRKNRPLAINTTLELRKVPLLKDLELIIVGEYLSQSEINQINSKNLEFISFFQNVSNVKLRELYTNAIFCIATSKYEGYGLPIIEANSLGVICLHNDLPSFMEISNSHNIVLDENCERNDWSEIATKIVEFDSKIDLAKETSKKFGFEIFLSSLKSTFYNET